MCNYGRKAGTNIMAGGEAFLKLAYRSINTLFCLFFDLFLTVFLSFFLPFLKLI